jgi:NDP-sugar pyrophosphorylase family protein
MRTSAFALAASLALPFPGVAREHAVELGGCTVDVGPDERFEQGRPAEVRPGETIRKVVALRGDVVIHAGAVVDQAVALGGSVVLEAGARARHDVLAIGGDVRLERDARVEESAVAIGGQVKVGKGARVDGKTFALSLQLDGKSLAAAIGAGIEELRRCKVVTVRDRLPDPAGEGAEAR